MNTINSSKRSEKSVYAKYVNRFLFLALLLLTLSFGKLSATQLSGSYTIDSAGTASASVFKNFSSVITYLTGTGVRSDGGPSNTSPFGVSGPVVFNVATGTYIEQVDITAITGVSATNTITFDGGAGNATTRIISFAGTASLPFTIRLNNTTYISIKNLTIRGTFTTAWPVHLFGSTACNNDTIKNCIIDFGSTSISSFSSATYFGIVFSGNATSYATTGNFANNVIDSNTIQGGYANISVYSNNSASTGGNVFTGNACNNAYLYGIYLSGINGGIIDRNTINMNANSTTSTGLYITGANALAATNNWSVSRNKIINIGQYGIYLYNSSAYSTNRGNLVNNFIGGGFRNTNPVGMYLYFFVSVNKYWNIYHNTVNIDNAATVAGSSCIYSYSCCNYNTADNFDFRNNILAVTNPASVATLFETPNWGNPYSFSSTTSFDYNLFYKAGATASTTVANNAGTAIPLSTLIGNGGYNTNSQIGNPIFYSPTDLRIADPSRRVPRISTVTSDYYGIARPTNTNIGAHENPGVSNDIGVSAITAPVIPFVAGSMNIAVTLRNYGTNTVNTANVSYSVNGGASVTQALTGLALAAGSSTTVTFSSGYAFYFAANTIYTLRAFSDSPNGGADAQPLNDSTSVSTIASALSGSYTIDQGSAASSTNFTSFTTATNALYYGGVSGPVVFNIIGTTPYNEQVRLLSIPGTSATNTITFDGGTGNAANRILVFSATTQASSYTFRIENTSWVRLRNFTIRGTGTTYAWPLHIMGNNASNNQVRNCIIDFGAGPGATGTSDNFTAVTVNGGSASVSTQTSAINIDIDSNSISGGQHGIYIYGAASTTQAYNMRGNTIANSNQNGIYVFYIYAFRIDNNIISMRQTGSATSYGLNINNCYSGGVFPYEIQNNIITDAGQYGMYIYYLQGGIGTNRTRVANNMIGGSFRNTDPAGIYFYQSCQNTDVWFNSINLDYAATGTQSAALKIMSSCSGLDVRNNNCAVTNASSTAYPLYCDAISSFNALDYNNYYKIGSPLKLINLQGVNYSLSNYRGAQGFNTNSASFDPSYLTVRNLRTNLLCNKGVSISGITYDIDGHTRNTPPAIGCSENTSPYSVDASAQFISNPSVPLATGTQNIKVVVRNNGSSTLTNMNVGYQVNGGTVQSQLWTGTLNPCDSATISFTATSGSGSSDQRYTFLPGSSYTIKAFTSSPNGSTDMNPANDTTTLGPLCTGLSGSFTIDGSLPSSSVNFTSFISAVNALSCGGVSGPVVFTVASGTYTGQADITDVPGASSTNTITFDGGAGNASTRIIDFALTTSNLPFTIRINSAQYIYLRNLTIRGSGTTYGWPLHIYGSSSNIKVKNCIVTFSGSGLTATSDQYDGIVINNYFGGSCPTCGQWTGSNLEIDSNTVIGGNASVYIYGIATNTGVFFRNNIFDSAYTYGVYANNVPAIKMISNRLELRSTGSASSYGLYYSSVNATTSDYVDISKNRITNAGGYGIYLGSSSGTAAYPSRMINNSVGGGFRTASPYGIYFTSSNYWNIWFNSVNIDYAATGATASAYFSSTSNNDCRNNNFAVTNASAGASVFPFQSLSGSTFLALNYNNYYKAGAPTNLIQVAGVNYTPSNYNTASAGGANSITINPAFTTNLNLTPTVTTIRGLQMLNVQKDINDSIRNNPPYLGAIEISSGLATDLGIINMYSPDTFLSAGTKDVNVTVRNFGTSAITFFHIRHSVNGANIQDSLYTGTLNYGDTLNVTLTGSKKVTLSPGVLSTFKVYVYLPNGSVDNNTINDTISIGPKMPAMSGAYTINPSFPATVTNFQTFRAATTALSQAGVAGPVTFSVSAGTFNEQVNIPAIAGASLNNTVTFDGGNGNAATRIIDTAANTATNYWTVMLNNSPYITFKNLTINASGSTYGVAVQISGSSNYSKFKNCIIQIGSAGANSTSNYFMPILITSATNITSPTSGTSQVNFLEIDSNTINNGYYGIYGYSYTGTPYCNNNKFRFNNFNNQYQYGIYLYYYDGYTFSNNTMNMRSVSGTSSYGAYFYFCYTTGTDVNTVTANKIYNAGYYGIYAYFGGNASGPYSIISNNMIGGGFRYNGATAMSLQYLNNYYIYNNSVNMDYTQTVDQYAAMYIYAGSGIDVRNNILANTAPTGNTGLPLYVGSLPTGLFRLDNNDYFKTSTTNSNLVYLAGTYYTNSNLVNGGGYNSFSINRNPGYASSTDLHITDACMRGVTLANVTTDIDGQTRNSPPNIGADEVSGINNDAGTMSIAPFTIGLQNVYVKIKNFGTNNLTSATVSYTVNGSLPKIVAWTGLLAPCDTTTVVFSGSNQYNFALGTAYTVVAYTSNPNLTTDPHTANDTTTLGPTCVFLSGNYTINPSGSGATNFTSFTAAATALNCGGVSAPVTFHVAAGTYTEQITLTNINGASATNTVIIDGDTAATRIITFSPTLSTEGHTIRLNSSSFVTIRNLTIQNTGSSFGAGVHFMGSSNYSKLKNCIVQLTGNAATSASGSYTGILINNYNDVNSPTATGSQVSNLEIDSNHIINGYYGIVINSYTGTPYINNVLIRKNSIDSSYYYGAYYYYNDGITFLNNTINMRINGSASSQGIYLMNCFAQGTNVHTITGNKIINAGQYGMYLYQSYSSSSTYRSRLANNMVGGGFRNSSATAIYCTYLNYWDIWNNSANLDFPVTSSTYAAMSVSNGSLHDIRNNILSYSATSGSGIPINVASTTILTALDYNDYYNSSSNNLVAAGASTYTNSNYLNGGGYNANSKNQNPGFTSPTDLHISSGCIRGTSISGITTDIFGTTRGTPPSIGAHEYTGSLNNDIGVSFLIAPASPFTAGTQDVKVRISNFGANIVTSATVKYSVNGGTPKSVVWSGSLNPCDTTSVLFTGTNQFNFALGNSYTIKAYTEAPNSTSDANKNNDTLATTLCPALNGTYTINPSGSGTSNFTSFTAAVSVLNCGGISGPVMFNISPGTYTGQFAIQQVSGASATNTITFRSANGVVSAVTLTYSSTGTADNYIVKLDGADYTKWSNITFVPQGLNYGNAFYITNTADYNVIDSCVFTGLSTSSATSNLALLFSNGTKDNYNTISNNLFSNASMGIYWSSNSSTYAAGNQILKNIFNNQYYSAIYTTYHDYLIIKQNTINASTGYTNYYGIFEQFTYNTSGASQIIKNKIIATIGGGYGIYSYYPNFGSNSSNRFLIANNMVQVNTTSTSTSYGIANQYSYYIDVMHNTVNVSAKPTGTSYAYYNYWFFSSTCFIQNNVFVNSTVGGGANSFAVYEQVFNAGTWNNNDYYSTGTYLGQWGGVSQATLAAWRTASSSQDLNSFNQLPVFASGSDLHFTNLPCLNNAGANVLAKVADDFDGNTRTSTPDIGAAEFTPFSLDATLAALRAPSGSLTVSSPYNVVVTARNNGSTIITSLIVGYRVNNGTPVTQTLSSLTLNPCDSIQVTFSSTSGPGSTDQRYYALGGLVGIKAYTASPNAGTDQNMLNDTSSYTFCTPFSGTFTINASQPASSTNFPSFTAAVNALTGCGGITGPVVFNVAAGTYNEQIDIPAITGSSSTNTITFDGGSGNAATRILINNSAASNSLHTLRLNNTQYVYVNNITIRGGSGSYGWPLHVYGNTSNVKVKNCIIDFTASGLSATSDNFVGIVVNNYSASASPTSGSWSGSNIEIDSNRILGGNTTIYIYGNGADTGVYFRKNTGDSAYTYGIYAYNLKQMKFNNNSLEMRYTGSTSSYGMYLNNCNTAAGYFHEVSGNKIINCGYVGVFLSGCMGQPSPRSQMFNNMIGGGFRNSNPSGIYFNSSSYNWDVFQNSVNMDNQASGTNSAGLYVGQCCTTGSTLLDVRNNIFAVTASGSSSYPIYCSNGGTYAVKSTTALNYNMYYKAGITNTQPFIYMAGNQTIANFIGNGGYNVNSISRNPNFVSAINLHVSDGCTKGDSLGVTTDIDGNARASYAVIGANEFIGSTNDIGVNAILQPTIPISPGLQNIQVILKNYGSNSVYTGTVKYSVNGGTPVSMLFTDTITPCDTSLQTFTGLLQYNFIGGNTYTIKVYTESPNGSADSFRGNDTITIGPVCVGMSGAFTINPSGIGTTNFTSFTNAINALMCAGVVGPTIFTVAAGTYTEQISIPAIPGASLLNPVIFDGGTGNAATRVLVNNTTVFGSQHTLRISTASFIQIRNITIRNTNTTYAWPLHLFGNCNNIKIKNCIIEITGSGATTNSTNFVSVVMNSSTTSVYGNAQQDSIEIDSNSINGGYASIWDYNNNGTANRFRGNTLNLPYYYGMYIYYSSEVKIKNNTINMLPSGSINSQGLYIYNCNNTGSMMHEVSGNKIVDMGQYGVYFYFTSGSFANPAQVFNNMIGGGFRNTTSHYGIDIEYGNYFSTWFNTVNSDTATSSNSGAINLVNSSQINVRNNLLVVSAQGSQELPLYAATTGNLSALDYNDYFISGTFSNLIYVGANYTASTFIGGSGFNNNSFSRDPLFAGKRDLHIGKNCLTGIALAAVPTDIYGTTRNTPPSVGAAEISGGLSNNIGVTNIVAPTSPVLAGSQNIAVIVSNLGNNLVTSYSVSYSVNGGTPVMVSVSDSLFPCDTSLITFSGTNQFTFAPGFSYTIKAYSSYPNGTADANHNDDTTTVGPMCTGMSGTYTINPSGSGITNFVSFNSAVSALQCSGVSGPVTFLVSNGTYNEQVNIGTINGVNDTTRVSFYGTNVNSTILTYAASSPTASHTLRLNNSSYINFYNMTIQATGTTYGCAVNILGSSNFSKIKRCNIFISGTAASATSSYFIPVMINNSSDITNPYTGTNVTNLEIDSNHIVAGYMSVLLYGRSATPYSGTNMFRKNIMDSAYQYGVYAYYEEALRFQNNTMNLRVVGNPGSYGTYLYFCQNTGSNYHDVSANRIVNAGQYGMYIYFCSNSSGAHGRFVNNMIGGGFKSSSATGVYMYYSDYWDIYSNTINLDYPTISNTYAAFACNYTNLNIRDNIFYYSALSGTGIPFYAGSTLTTLDYNDYYNAAATNLLSVNSTTYTSSTFVSGGGYNANSISATAPFVSPYNLHLTSSTNKGVIISSVTTDIDGEIRGLVAPDLGADEYYSAMDIGVLSIDSPTTVTFCGKSRNVIVKLKNYGNQVVSAATINVNINGVLSGSYTWSGTLGIGATSAQINVGSYLFSSGSYSLVVNTSAPNGGIDAVPANDSASTSFSVIPSVLPTISIYTPATNVCTGMVVTFTATATNGGTGPVYQWRKNGITVGTNDSFYTPSSLSNNDSIVCLYTSTANCATPATVVSNSIKMNVGTTLPPSVTISGNSSVCPGATVVLTAVPVNGGSTPHYQWIKNGINVGTDTTVYSFTSPVNNDSVRCVMTSTLSCASKPRDTSNFIKLTVNPFLTPSASITAKYTTLCAGINDTFIASVTNGGSSPIFQWKKNGIGFAVNNDTIVTSTLSNNDSVSLVVISNATCANPTNATSNKIGVHINPSVLPTATVTVTKNSICTGDSVTFHSTTTNGGSSPLKQWMKNGTLFTSGVDSFTTGALANSDTVYLVFTSNATCAVPPVVTSNKQIINVNSYVTPSVTMSASKNNICYGSSVQFTAASLNGGTSPHYYWMQNGSAVGYDSIRFTTNSLSNLDSIYVIMTSNAVCSTKPADTSARVFMTVNPIVTPSVAISSTSTSICAGIPATFTAGAVNGGSTPHYQWHKNGFNVGTDTAVFTTSAFANNDTVYVVLTSSATCVTAPTASSNHIVMTVGTPVTASVSINSNLNNICAGTPVTFTATPVNAGTSPVYQWKINGVNAGPNTTSFITASLTNKDTVYLTMVSSIYCAQPPLASSNKILMAVTPAVTPKISVSQSGTNVCSNTTITFTATDSSGGTTPSHRWFINGGLVGTDSVNFTTAVSYGDIIKCILHSNAACVTKSYDTATSSIVIKAAPVKPLVSRSHDTIMSTVAPAYQWYFNNGIISGAINRNYKVTQNGNYNVRVDSNGCSMLSDPFAFNNVGLKNVSSVEFISIAPNPSGGDVLLNAQFTSGDETVISVYDMSGRMLLQTNKGNTDKINDENIALSNFRSGIYLVMIKHGDSVSIRKIVRAD